MDEDRKQQEREDGFPSGREKTVSEAGVRHAGEIHDGHGQELPCFRISGHDMAGMNHMEQDHMGKLKQKFWGCLMVSIPIPLLFPMMGVHFPFWIFFAGSDWGVMWFLALFCFLRREPFFRWCDCRTKEVETGDDDTGFHGNFSGLILQSVYVCLGHAGSNDGGLTVLIIACTYALGPAIPLVVARLTSSVASNGLLIWNSHVVE